ncbi:ribosomal protein S7 (mitochondrion) [Hemiselmis andersenii]|uniref:Ribosomal protein S7 n=1 Tax=Hemiselmis andersenii TaxID=464988 RepID=B2MWV5_HEMAN|nr:ribosomal protein S7 [Hemiselmis andersenii]ACC78247.1 ribosomal protein S7 [Hemiselmis andersenii]
MSINIKKKLLISTYLKLFLKKGKQGKTEKLLKLSFSHIKKIKQLNPLILFLNFIKKARPFCEVKSLRVRGSIQKIPVIIKQNRQKSLVLRWLLTNTVTRNEKTIVESLSKELIETVALQSRTIKVCDEMHKLAELNKIFIPLKS